MLEIAKRNMTDLLTSLAIIRAGELRITESSKEEVDTFIYEKANELFQKYEAISSAGLTLAMLGEVFANMGQPLRDNNSSDDTRK